MPKPTSTMCLCGAPLPRFVRLPRAVYGEIPGRKLVAPPGMYAAHYNPNGALSVYATNGKLLGVRPAEWEREPDLTATLREVADGIRGELERGYVLTYEPNAGLEWRRRWNGLLGKVESVLADAAAKPPRPATKAPDAESGEGVQP